MNDEQVAAFWTLAAESIEREFPNKPSNVMTGPQDVLSPRQMHPVFYGSFDWHSSVHGHWLLVRLLKLHPSHRDAPMIRELLHRQLTREKIETETKYFEAKENQSFERMYGWAWVFRLALELHQWDDPDGRTWSDNLQPLVDRLVQLTEQYLPRLSFPIRTGEHPDTGFALGQALDFAREFELTQLEQLIVQYSREHYLGDADYPARYEPSGHDFFSTCLNEADLMRRVLSKEEFSEWLTQFLPELDRHDGSARSLLTPAQVTDVTDGKLVHLAGLNFNRAWTQAGILSHLEPGDPRISVLQKSIAEHREAGMEYVFSGHYEGEHWLATFAVYVLTGSGL